MGSLAERGLIPADLVLGVETVSAERAGALIDAHDAAPASRVSGHEEALHGPWQGRRA